LDGGERGRGRRGRYHHHAGRDRHVVGDGDGDARAVGADDGGDVLRADQLLGGGGGGGRVDAGRIRPHRGERDAVRQLARVGGLLHRHLGRVRHGGGDRLERPGEAEDDPDVDRLRHGSGGTGRGHDGARRRREKDALHLRVLPVVQVVLWSLPPAPPGGERQNHLIAQYIFAD